MPHNKLANLTGMPHRHIGTHVDHHPYQEAKCAGMSDAEMREFMREEQKEGMHPSLRGKHF